MTPALAVPAPLAATQDPVRKSGFLLLCAYLFITYSRILDVTVPGLHIPLVIGIALYGAAAFAGSIQRALATTPGKLLVLLTGLMTLAALFGAWPGGSLRLLNDNWARAFPLYFTVVGLCVTTSQIGQLLKVICAAVTTMAVIALLRGDNMDGRLIIDNSRFADPNDLALICLIAVALCCYLVVNGRGIFQKLLGALMLAPLLYAMARTGSRGAVIGVVGTVLYIFLKSSLLGKIKIAGAGAALVFSAAAFLPPEVYLRYVGLLGETEADNTRGMMAAEGSKEARLYLLQESLLITLTHPILGVGPGNFPVVENERAQAKGLRRGSWHVTHNMYTQVSSENGILAGLLYIAVVGLGIRATQRTTKLARQHRDPKMVVNSAFWIRVAMIAFAISGTFLSVAYCDMLPLIGGLAVALELAVRSEIRMAQGLVPAKAAPRIVPAFAGKV